MGIEVAFSGRALEKTEEIRTSDRRIAKSLKRRIDELRENPTPPSALLMKGEEFVYRIPFHGDYGRIIYRVISDTKVKILLIDTREKIYPQWVRLSAERRE